ncbi:aquaporin-5-like [Salvelinus fontinalis]|uniref:aquaporin-5-like n=1 Tax=Salvelinus fontinalis TaxID=8038 RepID=UPI002485DA0B|nr:aquaporin-5-like [Salvelinus fontinalis]
MGPRSKPDGGQTGHIMFTATKQQSAAHNLENAGEEEHCSYNIFNVSDPRAEPICGGIRLRTYTGETIPLLGALEVDIAYNSQEARARLLVVPIAVPCGCLVLLLLTPGCVSWQSDKQTEKQDNRETEIHSSIMQVLSSLALVLKNIWTLSFLRDLLCEFVGTAIFLFTSLASVVLWPQLPAWDGSLSSPTSDHHLHALSSESDPSFLSDSQPFSECHPDPLHVALAFGASVAVVSVCLGPATSGGGVHLNPAVTLALAAGLRVSPWRAVLYVGAQLLGALCACALLMGMVPVPLRGHLGMNEVALGVHPCQALTVETAITFQLVVCVLATSRAKSAFHLLGPVVVGLSVILGNLVAIGYTGCGMNPARSFGPAVVTLKFQNHWVYWVGPCAGALLAGLLHDLVLYPRWGSPGDWLAEFKELFPKDPLKQPTTLEHTVE